MPLKPAVSPAARRTIKSAFDELERTITPEDSLGFGSMTLEHVKKVSLEIEVQLAARQSLRNMRRLTPLFTGLQHYAKVLDILCNGTPYLPWIWAPITLILQVASEYVEAFEQIIKGYSRIAESLGGFEMLGKAFSSKLDFQQTLAVFYADILQFHGRAYKLVRRSSEFVLSMAAKSYAKRNILVGWRILFLTSWGRFQRQFNDVLDNMKRHGELVDPEANAHSITEVRQMREDIKAWRDDSLAQVRQLNEKESSKQYDSIMAWLRADEADQIAIFDALSAEGARHAGTCSWALKNPKVKLWLQEKPDVSPLWIQGAPGSGKSVLACEIAKFMKSANMFLIQHFCSQRYSSSTMYDQILRSLLLQLLRDNDELVAHVYEDCVLGKQSPTVHALEKLLLKLLKIASNEPRKTRYIWILIDGLNECETRKQTNVVRLVNQITGKTPDRADTVCKVLIVSRKSAPITSRLRMHQTLSLYEERNSLKLAIRQYVSQRLQSDSLHQRLRGLCVGSKEIEDIGRVITNKADGTCS
ncbi:hypothetical protein DL771_006361 [Monosporascus sp. 5C6A]|nr:hypothetical protein DL771_006361 [Monosporascus sp. 5C6A]